MRKYIKHSINKYIVRWLKPTKKSIKTFIIVGSIYEVFIFMKIIFSSCTMLYIVCSQKPHHNVPNIFPGSMSCQVCASNSELILGYAQIILVYFLIPLIIIYFLSSLLNLKR